MKKTWMGIFAVFVLLSVFGCAGQLPKHAMMDSKDAVAFEFEKVDSVVTFDIIINPIILYELVPFKNKDGKEMANGFFPIIAEDEKNNGLCWFKRINTWLEMEAKCMVKGTFEMIEQAKYIFSNRDGGFLFNLKGDPIEIEKQKDSPLTYDIKRLDKDKPYRNIVFKNGMTVRGDLESHWQEKIKKEDPEAKIVNALECKVGSPQWKYLLNNMSKVIPNVYVMDDEQIFASFSDEKEFKNRMADLTDSKVTNRILKETKIDFTLLAAIIGTGVSISNPLFLFAMVPYLNNAVSAARKDNIQGDFLRAKKELYKLSRVMKWYDGEIKKINQEKIDEIKKQNKQIEFARGER